MEAPVCNMTLRDDRKKEGLVGKNDYVLSPGRHG